MRVFLVGPPGSGKSTVGKFVAAHLNAQFFDLDEVIKERAGADIPWIFDVEGESGFRDREEAVVSDFCAQENVVVATGGGVIIRDKNRATMKAHCTVVYLSATLDTLVARTAGKDKRPLLAGKDPRPILAQMLEVRGPLYEEVADVTVVSTGGSAKKLAAVIVDKLAQFAETRDD
jgi:shikimate kinase